MVKASRRVLSSSLMNPEIKARREFPPGSKRNIFALHQSGKHKRLHKRREQRGDDGRNETLESFYQLIASQISRKLHAMIFPRYQTYNCSLAREAQARPAPSKQRPESISSLSQHRSHNWIIPQEVRKNFWQRLAAVYFFFLRP